MRSVGGSASSARSLGERNKKTASRIMRSIIFFALLLSLASAVSCTREQFIDVVRVFPGFGGAEDFSLTKLPQDTKLVVVNFYAPDCPPCENEIPALKAFHKAQKSNTSLRFVSIASSLRAVNAGDKEAIARAQIVKEAEAFTKKFSLAYPQQSADAADLKSWRVTGFPETFVFKRGEKGFVLAQKFISEISEASLHEAIK